ncbi:MAG TPA: LysR substrate-binding domain-containing protein [Friedmanniella sp.]
MAANLDLTQLRTFVAVVECGGQERAAAALHLSQPTVSQHVKLLERRLRQTLTRRNGRRTELTTDGERLLVEARRILAVHDDAVERLAAGSLSSVVIGSTETAAEQVLPGLLAVLRDAYPATAVTFRIDRSTQMAEAVGRGAIDLAVLLGLGSEVPGRQVGALPLSWFAAPGRLATQLDPNAPIPLVAFVEPCGMRQLAVTELAATGRSIEVVAESTSLEGVLAAARAGLGVAVLPSAGAIPAGLRPVPHLPDLGAIGVFLAARRGLDVDLEAAALSALETFFAGLHPTILLAVER